MEIYELSYNEINEMPNNIKKELLEKFKTIMQSIPDEIYRSDKKLYEMIYEAELLEEEKISDYIFSGEKVIYYKNEIYRKSMSSFTSAVTGYNFPRGTSAFIWKPFMYLPEKKEVYTIKPIKVLETESDFFPTNIKGFDDFCYKVKNSYDLGLDEYYNFLMNTGGIQIKKLR